MESAYCSRALQHCRFLLSLRLRFISETVAALQRGLTVRYGFTEKRRSLLVENWLNLHQFRNVDTETVNIQLDNSA